MSLTWKTKSIDRGSAHLCSNYLVINFSSAVELRSDFLICDSLSIAQPLGKILLSLILLVTGDF